MGEVKKPYPQNLEDIMYIIVLEQETLLRNFTIGVIQLYILGMQRMETTETTVIMGQMVHKDLLLHLKGLTNLLNIIMELIIGQV